MHCRSSLYVKLLHAGGWQKKDRTDEQSSLQRR
jgi:hypothetical protein